jgi:hypothetical protein
MENFNNPAKREEIMIAFDTEMVKRGAKAVEQSLSEADKSLNLETVNSMLMAQKGIAKTA